MIFVVMLRVMLLRDDDDDDDDSRCRLGSSDGGGISGSDIGGETLRDNDSCGSKDGSAL